MRRAVEARPRLLLEHPPTRPPPPLPTSWSPPPQPPRAQAKRHNQARTLATFCGKARTCRAAPSASSALSSLVLLVLMEGAPHPPLRRRPLLHLRARGSEGIRRHEWDVPEQDFEIVHRCVGQQSAHLQHLAHARGGAAKQAPRRSWRGALIRRAVREPPTRASRAAQRARAAAEACGESAVGRGLDDAAAAEVGIAGARRSKSYLCNRRNGGPKTV